MKYWLVFASFLVHICRNFLYGKENIQPFNACHLQCNPVHTSHRAAGYIP